MLKFSAAGASLTLHRKTAFPKTVYPFDWNGERDTLNFQWLWKTGIDVA